MLSARASKPSVYFLRSLRMAASCAASVASSASTVAISCLSLALARASSAAFSALILMEMG